MTSEVFADLACEPDPPVEELALGLAAAFAPVQAVDVREQLDLLGQEVRDQLRAGRTPAAELAALEEVVGRRHGFAGDQREYDHPDNSMLPRVLERRRGLPITLSVVYVAVARRARIPLVGVGLPGHYVAGRFDPAPQLIDPFGGGGRIDVPDGVPASLVRPTTPHDTALRMLNNLTASYTRRGMVGQAIRAAELRLLLPVEAPALEHLRMDLRQLRARMN